jgi:hypothetical protein
MPDLHDFLDDEARRVRAKPDALGGVLDRANRRRRAKRIATGVLALAVAGGGIGLAIAAFRPARQVEPGSLPVPGPSASRTPTTRGGAITGVVIRNGSSSEGAAEFAAALLPSDSVAAEVTSMVPAAGQEVTTIHHPPTREEQAVFLRDCCFPGAELRPQTDPNSILVTIGDGFIAERRVLFENFKAVRSFMTRRVEGNGAEVLLTEGAARQFEDAGGLSLYDYAANGAFWIDDLYPGEYATAVAKVVIVTAAGGDAVVIEHLTVGDREPEDDRPEILAAELIGGPIGPTVGEVRAFVRGFLEARRETSGAGTYLGEEARQAYVSHEGGLDLLRYAADQDLVNARVIRYTRLGPNRYEVLVRFNLSRPVEPLRVYELLTIERLGEDGFVVADAERWRPD